MKPNVEFVNFVIASLAYTNLCIDFPDVSTCISPINYEGLHRGIRSRTV